MTKLGPKSVHTVRCRGGNMKYRAMRLETGNFAWGSEVITKKVRVLDVVYNASNNELVRTKTLVKGAIVLIAANPFKEFFDSMPEDQRGPMMALFEKTFPAFLAQEMEEQQMQAEKLRKEIEKEY